MLTSRLPAAALYIWTIAVLYTALGIGGWFVDGLLLGTPIAIPLGPADNIFHLLLGIPALAVGLISHRSTLDRVKAEQDPVG